MTRVPRDLVAVVTLTALAAVALLGTEPGTVFTTPFGAAPADVAIRLVSVAFGLAFLLFLPGYAVSAAMFPRQERPVETVGEESESITSRFRFRGRKGVDTLERVALSLGFSAVVTPMLALALNFTPLGVSTVPLVVLIGGFTVVVAVVAAVRRWRLPPDERFAPSLQPAVSPLWSGWGDRRLATVALVLGLLIAAVGIGYAVTVPKPGAKFTELYVLSQNENGTFVADDYPEELSATEPTPFVVGIENREGRRTNYVGVVQLQRIKNGRVVERTRVRKFSTTLDPGRSDRVRVRLLAKSDQNVRMRVLLYRGSLPEEPRAGSAYRMVELRFDGANETVTTTPTSNATKATTSTATTAAATATTATATTTTTDPAANGSP